MTSGLTLAAFDADSGRLVGELVLFLRSREHRRGEVGYVLHPDFWGRGLATEGANALLEIAFDTLDLHRVIARLDARNAASAAVLERLGMRREAVLVEHTWFKGEWSTEADYAILQDEWVSRGTRSLISSKTMAPASSSASVEDSPPPKP